MTRTDQALLAWSPLPPGDGIVARQPLSWLIQLGSLAGELYQQDGTGPPRVCEHRARQREQQECRLRQL